MKGEKKEQQDKQKFEQSLASQPAQLLGEDLQLLEGNLDQQGFAYEAFKAARKTAQVAEIGINLVNELQNNALWVSNPPTRCRPFPVPSWPKCWLRMGWPSPGP